MCKFDNKKTDGMNQEDDRYFELLNLGGLSVSTSTSTTKKIFYQYIF